MEALLILVQFGAGMTMIVLAALHLIDIWTGSHGLQQDS